MDNPSIGNRSAAAHNFSRVPKAEIQRSVFDRSHTLKTTFSASYLIPVFVDEALPGDTFNLNMTAFARLSTFKRPIMDNLYMDVFFFSVPNRLVWDSWEEFCGNNIAPPGNTPPVNNLTVPFVLFQTAATPPAPVVFAPCTIFDYFGLPVGKRYGASSVDMNCTTGFVNALPFRAYNLIYNEWFRDENLVPTANVNTTSTPEYYTDYILRKRGKRHDYFTSALPWPQKGPAVSLGLNGLAPVQPVLGYSISNAQGLPSWNGTPYSGIVTRGYNANYDPGKTTTDVFQQSTNIGNFQPLGTNAAIPGAALSPGIPGATYTGISSYLYWNNSTGLVANLGGSTSFSINALRNAFQIQRLYERDARGGTRYTEILKSHFGVTSPDARLQRPEYLGGGTVNININPIAATGTSDTTQLGDLGAIGTAAIHKVGFTKSFVEHCYVIGLVNVRSDLTYWQGLNKLWSRRTRFDYYWPALSHLGEQVVTNAEIYYQGPQVADVNNVAIDSQAFGYQERYAEYRYKPSMITGIFQSSASPSLDNWHLAQNFTALPALNQSFIEEQVPMSRVEVAQVAGADFLMDAHFSYRCARPMPVYGVPGFIDHF